MKELKVGDTVWLEWHGNMARRGTGKTQSQITKIGRYYIYTDEGKFSKETGWQISNYSADYRLWVTLNKLSEHQEKNKLYKDIASKFKTYDCPYTLDQLRAIHKIIN